MSLKGKFDRWIKTLSPYDKSKVYVWLAPAGLGDKITHLPAFRHLKKMYPERQVVLYTEPLVSELWKSCRYIDTIIPEDCIRGEGALYINPERDMGIRAWWSFYEHHQKHIVKSSVEHICNIDYSDDIPLDFELDVFGYDLPEIEKSKNKLTELARGKKIAVIAPAYTMFSRMWSVAYWETLTKYLKHRDYFVLALGGNNDLKIKNVDLDMCGKYPIRHVPHLLDIVDVVFTLNSGMLHLSSVNQKVPIVYISVGQFPPDLIAPYRNGKLADGMLIIEHDCPLKAECFDEHITEKGINEQAQSFLNQLNAPLANKDMPLLQKFICWHYCKKVVEKYKCAEMIEPETVLSKFIEWKEDR